MNFNRFTFDVLSVVLVVCYLELNHFNILFDSNVVNTLLGLLFLIYPLFNLSLKIGQKLNAKSASTPLVINFETKRVDFSWGGEKSFNVTPEMSIFEYLHVHPTKLQVLLSSVLSKAGSSKPTFTISPVILINVDVSLSDLEREKITWILFEIGALDVIITEDDKESTKALSNPQTQCAH